MNYSNLLSKNFCIFQSLQEPLKGLRSIDITADYRAVYEEIYGGDEQTAYFVGLGTHEELYKKNNSES